MEKAAQPAATRARAAKAATGSPRDRSARTPQFAGSGYLPTLAAAIGQSPVVQAQHRWQQAADESPIVQRSLSEMASGPAQPVAQRRETPKGPELSDLPERGGLGRDPLKEPPGGKTTKE